METDITLITGEGDADGLGEGLGDMEFDGLGDGEVVGLGETVTVGLGEGDASGEEVGNGDNVATGDGEGLAVEDAEGVGVGFPILGFELGGAEKFELPQPDSPKSNINNDDILFLFNCIEINSSRQ
jgi:hypothetical protein